MGKLKFVSMVWDLFRRLCVYFDNYQRLFPRKLNIQSIQKSDDEKKRFIFWTVTKIVAFRERKSQS